MRSANSKSLCNGTRREDYRLILCSQGTPYNVFTKRYSTDLVLLLECNFKVCLKMFWVRRLMIGTPDNDCIKQRSLNAIVHYPLHNDTPFNVLEVSLPSNWVELIAILHRRWFLVVALRVTRISIRCCCI